MTELPIITSLRNRTGIIELNRPQALNSLNQEMVTLIGQALVQWRDDDAVEQVLVLSKHPRAFCAGGDVREVRAGILDHQPEAVHAYFQEEYDLNHLIATYPKPYISVIDGVVMGGGLGLSAHGSHLIVTDQAFASMPEMLIGYVTDVGVAYRAQRMVGTRGVASPALAKFWGLTAYRMYAADMLYSGLATGWVKDAQEYCEAVIAGGVDSAASLLVDNPAPAEAPLAKYIDAIEVAFAHTQWEEILAACTPELREMVLKLTEQACPTSLVAALELFAYEEQAASVREALDAELRLGTYLVRRPDFAEGVRAVLVDKTADPAFVPAVLADVDRAAITAALAP